MRMNFIKKAQQNYNLRKYVDATQKLNRVNAYLAGITEPDLWPDEVAMAREERALLQRRLSTIATKLRS